MNKTNRFNFDHWLMTSDTSLFIKLNTYILNVITAAYVFPTRLFRFMTLFEFMEKIITKGQFTITQQFKRVHSIKLKLKRFERMQLSRMDNVVSLRRVLGEF